MTIEDTIKKLTNDNDRLWKLIYGKWKKRRIRNKEKLTLEKCREKAIVEYYTLREQIKYGDKTPSNVDLEPNDYYVQITGTPMRNSKWKELIELQKTLANTDLTPSPIWELRHIHYLKVYSEIKMNHTKIIQ